MTAKRIRRREFLDEMEKVVPWDDLVALVSPFLQQGKRGRPPFPPETMLRIHFMQQWFALCDPATEEALSDMPVFRSCWPVRPLALAARSTYLSGHRCMPSILDNVLLSKW